MEVLRDQKFAKLSEQLNGVKTIAEAQAKGAKVDTLSQVTFSSPVSVPSIMAYEPALSGAISGVEKGACVKAPVKGYSGAYFFQVLDRAQREGVQYNADQQMKTLRQQNVQQTVNMALQELRTLVDIEDNRYIFF